MSFFVTLGELHDLLYVATCGNKGMIACLPCTPPMNLETFSEKSQHFNCSGKKISGLKKKKMKNITMTQKSRNHVRADSRVEN